MFFATSRTPTAVSASLLVGVGGRGKFVTDPLDMDRERWKIDGGQVGMMICGGGVPEPDRVNFWRANRVVEVAALAGAVLADKEGSLSLSTTADKSGSEGDTGTAVQGAAAPIGLSDDPVEFEEDCEDIATCPAQAAVNGQQRWN